MINSKPDHGETVVGEGGGPAYDFQVFFDDVEREHNALETETKGIAERLAALRAEFDTLSAEFDALSEDVAEAVLGASFMLPVYVKASLPPVAVGGLIYVSDDVGGAVPAFSDGVNWLRVTDRAVVS